MSKLNNFLVCSTAPTDMRYSVELCEEEKKFLQKREKFVFEAMKKLLGKDGPKTIDEVSATITRAQNLMNTRMIIFGKIRHPYLS